MKVKNLLKNLPVTLFKGTQETQISGISAHSKLVAPGDLFLSRRSASGEEERFIDEAKAAGAVAVLTDLPNPARKNLVQLICADVREIEGKLASFFYGEPSHSLFSVGVTGTNGKTTTTFLLHHLFETLGVPSGLLGTIEYRLGHHIIPAELTTPEASQIQKMLKEMVGQKCLAVFMEASSIGIDQKRIQGIDFDVGVFTNFSQDHLDYHGSMEAYFEAKKALFLSLDSKAYAVVNDQEKMSKAILEGGKARPFWYGFCPTSDLFVRDYTLKEEGVFVKLHAKGEESTTLLPLIGAYNVHNALAAVSVGLIKGFSLDECCKALESFPGVPGRLERVLPHYSSPIFVDYAHTPDALERVIKALKEHFPQKNLHVVFGAGGNRDRSKRPLMGELASKWADYLWITSDNPRTEDPEKICREVASGIEKDTYQIVCDRKSAIEKALERASDQDLILIAGKGHETTQTIGNISYPFDDRRVVQEFLCAKL